MPRYRLDAQKLKDIVRQKGFLHLNEFAKAFNVNRATLHHYLKGIGPISECYYNLCENLDIDPLEILSPIPQSPVREYSEIIPVARALCREDFSLCVGLLGSRAKGTEKKYSDWDIGVTRGPAQISAREFLKIKQSVEDMAEDIPRKIDVVNLSAAPAWFIQAIDYEPVFLAGNKASWAFFMGVIHGAKKEK